VRVNPRRPSSAEEVRHRIARLECIPLRPLTARMLSTAVAPETDDELTRLRAQSGVQYSSWIPVGCSPKLAPPVTSNRSPSWPERRGGSPLLVPRLLGTSSAGSGVTR